MSGPFGRNRVVLCTVMVMVGTLIAGFAGALTRGPAPEVSPRLLTDSEGRTLFLRGFNTASSAKNPTGLADLTEEDVAREYSDMGTNFVRLLLQWQAVEPEPGEIDQDYLDEVEKRVGWYEKRGYHVMLDMHQDLYSTYTSSEHVAGNGAPEWATQNDRLPVAEDLDMWELYYLEPGVIRSFDNFWGTSDNDLDLMDHYAKSWGAVAERFADNEAVLAYDLMNEPWGGTLQAAEFERGPLAEFYRRSIAEIRQSDSDTWLFVEPQAVGVNWGMTSALPAFDDPRDGEDRIGFAPHLYPLPMDLGKSYASAKEEVDDALATWEDSVLRTAERLDAPVILGEFGLDATAPGALDYVDAVIDMTERTGMGYAYWSNDPGSWGPYNGDGEPQPLADTLNRAYPRAVAGEPLSISTTDIHLTLSYRTDPQVTAPTEIYLPESFGAGGGSVSCGADCETNWDAERRVLSVTQAPESGVAAVEVRAA
ncbi:cellulase family glycosylhydrolase [Salininema proteolyticum]|uniref:Cellulase family glycosylhydrolase n=1 Tax=Salininema proteolyticum TaxID=1607685 RepID=A0ABV8U0H8_9ACTN